MLPVILSVQQSPCLSLYMSTHRSHPENLQDPILFKQLVKQLESSLLINYPADVTKQYLEQFDALANDSEFWNHTLDGVAVLSAKDFFEVIGLQDKVASLAVVAEGFHTKPLQQYLQSVDRYHVLGISLHDFQLFEGNRTGISRVDIAPGIPTTIEEALGDELTDKHLTVASYGGAGPSTGNMYHGHGGKKEEVDKDAERFFRVVTASVQKHYSKPSGLPLILAALPEHHHLFQQVSDNPLLLPEGIKVNPSAVTNEQLAQLAWEVMEPAYNTTLENLGEKFGGAKANGKGSDHIAEVAEAAATGKIDTLLIAADKTIAGKLVTENNSIRIVPGDISHPEVDDVLDDIGELVVKMGGRIVVMPQEKMPTATGIAAIYRY